MLLQSAHHSLSNGLSLGLGGWLMLFLNYFWENGLQGITGSHWGCSSTVNSQIFRYYVIIAIIGIKLTVFGPICADTVSLTLLRLTRNLMSLTWLKWTSQSQLSPSALGCSVFQHPCRRTRQSSSLKTAGTEIWHLWMESVSQKENSSWRYRVSRQGHRCADVLH